MPNNSKLGIIWSSPDPEVALNMVFMYAENSKLYQWWDIVRLIVWGPSAKLLTEDADLQKEFKSLKQVGVDLVACKACADRYGVSDDLSKMDVAVVYVGEMVTEMLKSNWKMITF